MSEPVRWLTPPELAAWIGLIRVSSRVVALADGELRRRHSITGRDYELLHTLSGGRGMRINELAAVIDDSSSCITHRVNRLRSAGLVDKQRDPIDSRARLVSLTERGETLLHNAAPDHAARVRRWVIDPLSTSELAVLRRLTNKISEHLRVVEPLGP